MTNAIDPSDIKFALELGHKYSYVLFMDYTKVLFWFALQLLSETSLILRRIQRDKIINVHRPSCKVPAFLVRLNKLGFSGQIFEKSSNVTYHENLSSGSRDVAPEKTDRQEILRTSLKT